jgi:folate-binding protein YgfZ
MENLRSMPDNYYFLALEGKDAWDFGHRLFSRNIEKLQLNEGVLSLFLSSKAKVLAMFWVIKVKDGLNLIVRETELKALCELIEKYHFTEDFEVKPPVKIQGAWASVSETSFKDSFGELHWDNKFVGFWRNTLFQFDLGGLENELPVDSGAWQKQRTEQKILQNPDDYSAATLVFHAGLEALCDEAKGCYIGQEIVERVRSRAKK